MRLVAALTIVLALGACSGTPPKLEPVVAGVVFGAAACAVTGACVIP